MKTQTSTTPSLPDENGHEDARSSRKRRNQNATEDGTRDSPEMSYNISKGGRRMAGDRRGSQDQGPGTKTEAGNCPGEQDRATQDQHRHHRPGKREQGTKEPQSRREVSQE